MKKLIWLSVGTVVPIFAWVLWPRTPAVHVVSHDPSFVIYDVQYFASTNRIHYWRAAWCDALGFFGFMQARWQGQALQRGPALVIYHSTQKAPSVPMLLNEGEKNMCSTWSTEYFGSKSVTKYFGRLPNGEYHLKGFGHTNAADITINLKSN